MITEVFDRIMKHEDLSPLMTDKPEAAQCFADTFWEGKPIVFPRNKKGEMKGAAGRNAVPVYTNRRWHAGTDWAIELHTANIPAGGLGGDTGGALEVAVVMQLDQKGSGKFQLLQEFADPKTMTPKAASAKL